MVADEDEVMVGSHKTQDQESEVLSSPTAQAEEEVWLCHFGDYHRMGPGGTVASSIRNPGS